MGPFRGQPAGKAQHAGFGDAVRHNAVKSHMRAHRGDAQNPSDVFGLFEVRITHPAKLEQGFQVDVLDFFIAVHVKFLCALLMCDARIVDEKI